MPPTLYTGPAAKSLISVKANLSGSARGSFAARLERPRKSAANELTHSLACRIGDLEWRFIEDRRITQQGPLLIGVRRGRGVSGCAGIKIPQSAAGTRRAE
jgi:hypothetical protein